MPRRRPAVADLPSVDPGHPGRPASAYSPASGRKPLPMAEASNSPVALLASAHPLEVFAGVVGTAMLVIAAAQWIASYHADRRALRLFALRYVAASAGWFFSHPYAQGPEQGAPFVSMVVGTLLSAWTLFALDEFLEQATARRRLAIAGGALAAVAALAAYKQLAPDDPRGIYLVMAIIMAICALMAWRAAAREANVGHHFVALACASFPLAITLAWAIDGNYYELGYFIAVPSALVGVAVLVVSLIRAGRRAEAALAEQRRAERALRELNTTLEQRVAERTAALQSLVDGLESFTRNVAHDLRGPLAGLSGALRLARESVAAGEAGRALRLLDAAAPQADQLSTLVQDLLRLSRSAGAPCERVEQPLAPLVHEALAQLAESPAEANDLRRVQVEVDELPSAAVDAPMLRQVFVNLIGNAVRFAAANGAPARVRVGAREHEGHTEVFVADSGAGFAPEQAARLFEPFALLHTGTLSRSGIGLSIVRRIVERHGGRAWAEGRPGAGATFWFSLGPLR